MVTNLCSFGCDIGNVAGCGFGFTTGCGATLKFPPVGLKFDDCVGTPLDGSDEFDCGKLFPDIKPCKAGRNLLINSGSS